MLFTNNPVGVRARLRRWWEWHVVGYLHSHLEQGRLFDSCPGCQEWKAERERREKR